MKLCSSNDDSPPSDNSDDLRARILLMLSASAQSEGKIDECDERNNEAVEGNLESGKSDSFLDCSARRLLVLESRQSSAIHCVASDAFDFPQLGRDRGTARTYRRHWIGFHHRRSSQLSAGFHSFGSRTINQQRSRRS